MVLTAGFHDLLKLRNSACFKRVFMIEDLLRLLFLVTL